MIVADTGAIIALLDRKERHHRPLRKLFEEAPQRWILPWAILPEVDYLASTQLGPSVEQAFLGDIAEGRFLVEWGIPSDLGRAQEIATRYKSLHLGLTDAVVVSIAERLGASAIATLDLRHFGAIAIRGNPKLLPRDL